MVGVVVVAHYRLGEELLQALRLIVPESRGFAAVSVEPKQSIDEMRAAIADAIDRVRDEVRPDPRDADELHDTAQVSDTCYEALERHFAPEQIVDEGIAVTSTGRAGPQREAPLPSGTLNRLLHKEITIPQASRLHWPRGMPPRPRRRPWRTTCTKSRSPPKPGER